MNALLTPSGFFAGASSRGAREEQESRFTYETIGVGVGFGVGVVGEVGVGARLGFGFGSGFGFGLFFEMAKQRG